ncbi:MAG: hypothetical protein HY074_11605 [Deltaproteobacteria bacterium]|nr:hypothetical protein [Deltaproteobacteria bacterium]
MTTIVRLPGPQTCMIGSLPHHNIDAALAMSMQVDIPFLPQIPIRNPWEFMIAQALEGMPGLNVEEDGSVALDVQVWRGRSHALNDRLLNAFAAMPVRHEAFESFEPSSSTSSGWQPFLWELHERGIKTAKVQIAGPLTAQWALRLKDGSNIGKHTDLTTQIYRLVLARALAMCRRLQTDGIQPVLYLDEPGLYGFTASDPRHALALQELRILVKALRKEGVTVGLHCCSNTDWSAVLSLDINILSIDAKLSFASLLQRSEEVENFLRTGGRLSLGVIPTTKIAEDDVRILFEELLEIFGKSPLSRQPELVRKALYDAIYTPACGLALHSTADAETVLATLLEFKQFCRQTLG